MDDSTILQTVPYSVYLCMYIFDYIKTEDVSLSFVHIRIYNFYRILSQVSAESILDGQSSPKPKFH